MQEVQDTDYCCAGYCCCTGYGTQDTGYRIQKLGYYYRTVYWSISKFGYISREFHSDCWMFVFYSHISNLIVNNLPWLLTSTSAASASEVRFVGWSRLTKRGGWSFLRKLHTEREGVHPQQSTLSLIFCRTDCLAFCSLFLQDSSSSSGAV